MESVTNQPQLQFIVVQEFPEGIFETVEHGTCAIGKVCHPVSPPVNGFTDLIRRGITVPDGNFFAGFDCLGNKLHGAGHFGGDVDGEITVPGGIVDFPEKIPVGLFDGVKVMVSAPALFKRDENTFVKESENDLVEKGIPGALF